MRCSEHPNASVTAMGVRERPSGPRQRYRCVPADGEAHTFSLPLDGRGEPVIRPWTVPPSCPKHPDGKVKRDGTYGVRTPQPRQRYRCTYVNEEGETKRHTFTPPLARHHVHDREEGCGECETLRGLHRGETTVARQHSWPTNIVARGLFELSQGSSYADVSRWALRVADATASHYEELTKEQSHDDPVRGTHLEGASRETPVEVASERRYRRTRRRAGDAAVAATTPLTVSSAGYGPVSRKSKNARSAESHNVWHIAADWCEVFGPVVFHVVDARLREQARAERARLDARLATGLPLDRPQVLLLDDIPVYGRDRSAGGKLRRDDGFFLLVAAEVVWGKEPSDPMAGVDRALRLRLVRAMSKSIAPAWRLVLDELGYAPDFVVADAGTGISLAIQQHFADTRTTFVPSLWHVAAAVRGGLVDTPGAFVPGPAGREPLPALATHLRELSRKGALADVATWAAWWDELETICVAHALPLDKVRSRRKNYEQPFAQAISLLVDHPEVPVSTGGLETVMAKHVQPMLATRRTGFANIERTNRLFDLVVAREHGAFDDLAAVARQLRADATGETATRHPGWTAPLRAVGDPRSPEGRYSSLRDTVAIIELAESRGLA